MDLLYRCYYTTFITMFDKSLYWLTPIVVIASATACFSVQYLTLEQAQRACFPTATQWIATPVELTRDQMALIEKDSGIPVRFHEQKVWAAYHGSAFLGWVILDSVLGKHEAIQWVLALEKEGSIRQIEILEYKETFGSEIRQKKWQSQFFGKKHGAKLKLNQDIQNISGATLSSRHVTQGVKRLLSFYELILKPH